MEKLLEISNIDLGSVNIADFVIGFLLSLITGIMLKNIYYKYSLGVTNKKLFSSYFPLFSIAIFVIVITIKSSIVLSLGLVGALSIIRFRTAIKEAEQIIYLLIMTGISIALAASEYVYTFFLIGTTYLYSFYTYKKGMKDFIYQNEILLLKFKSLGEKQLSELFEFFEKTESEVVLQSLSSEKEESTVILKCTEINKDFLIKLNSLSESDKNLIAYQIYNSIE